MVLERLFGEGASPGFAGPLPLAAFQADAAARLLALLGTRVPGNVAQSLERFEDVYLVLDPDEAGREATAELCKRLGDRAIPVALPPGVSDLNGLGRRPDGRSILTRCILQAGREARSARRAA